MTVVMYIVNGNLRSRESILENKRTILEAAGRPFRKCGFEPVPVAVVMMSAGLTHGGFYGYFER